MKKVIITIVFIIIIIALIITLIILKRNKNIQNNKAENQEALNQEKNEIIQNIVQEVGKEKISIEEYIDSIHPVKEGDTFPIFESIQEAEEYWLWSTALENAGTKEMGTTYAKKSDIINTAKKLYGNYIPEFPEDEEILEILDIHYVSGNDSYSFTGNSRSIPENSFYVILSNTEIEKDTYEVEIAEYLVYEWAEPYVLIEDIYGNILARFDFNDDYSNSEELEFEMQNYINENINNFNKKILTIKYDKYNGNYNIISSKEI